MGFMDDISNAVYDAQTRSANQNAEDEDNEVVIELSDSVYKFYNAIAEHEDKPLEEIISRYLTSGMLDSIANITGYRSM
jgi:hypothetical protein